MTLWKMEESYPSSELRGLEMQQLDEIREWICNLPEFEEVGAVSAQQDSEATSKRISVFGIYEIVYDRAYK
jgi:hypothetical protein